MSTYIKLPFGLAYYRNPSLKAKYVTFDHDPYKKLWFGFWLKC